MRAKFILLSLTLFLSGTMSLAAPAHFDDEDGQALTEFEPIHALLQEYFGDSVPERISVIFTDRNISQFNTERNEVLISKASRFPYCTVGHESAHLALAAFTRGESREEQFRFFDEGFAKIFDARLCLRSAEYKREAMQIAAEKLQAGMVSFDLVQRWSEYFGAPSKGVAGKWWAYQVGSSFDFYVLDTYGLPALLGFFRAVGETRSLEEALLASLGKDQQSIEQEWLTYVRNATPVLEAPKIVRRVPAEGERNVSLDLDEIEVEFDQPMQKRISLKTPCAKGVCYRNARWKTDRLLVIKVQLEPEHEYRLALGSEQNNLRGRNGAAFPRTEWTFHTGR